jgi:hypothetical protein
MRCVVFCGREGYEYVTVCSRHWEGTKELLTDNEIPYSVSPLPVSPDVQCEVCEYQEPLEQAQERLQLMRALR